MNARTYAQALSEIDLTNNEERFALSRRIVRAAEEHAARTHESDFLQGDMEIVLNTLMGEMSPDQIRAAFARLVPSLDDAFPSNDTEDAADSDNFAGLDEYAFLGR